MIKLSLNIYRLGALEITLHQLGCYYTAGNHHHHDCGRVENAGLVLLQFSLYFVNSFRDGNIICRMIVRVQIRQLMGVVEANGQCDHLLRM